MFNKVILFVQRHTTMFVQVYATSSENGPGNVGGHVVNQAPPPLPTVQEGKPCSTKP